jgi:hypothetical protein
LLSDFFSQFTDERLLQAASSFPKIQLAALALFTQAQLEACTTYSQSREKNEMQEIFDQENHTKLNCKECERERKRRFELLRRRKFENRGNK